jgi:hypothetical protein
MLSVYKGNVHPVGLTLASRAQTDKNGMALAAEGRCTGNLFLCCADLNASN